MKLYHATADLYAPDGAPFPQALNRATHIGVGAHQDDLEFMAIHGILACYRKTEARFAGVTCTNGAGSSRIGPYANHTDAQMQVVRRREQRDAAQIGDYAAMLQLDYSSAELKDAANAALKNDLIAIFSAARPSVVYTHNLADKHETHVAVAAAVVQALRALPAAQRPAKVYGCEIWRALDWLHDADKVLLDVSARENLSAALSGVFDSQISGGKRYDLAVLGRRRANATFLEPHGVDQATHLTFAMDLTPLVKDASLDPAQYVTGYIRKFQEDVEQKIRARWVKGA
jgi:LmbE family N-acetylglucosaminyl deacetylase